MSDIVTDPELKVLVERMNNYLDGQKRIEGQLNMIVQLQLSLTEQGQQIKSLQGGQERLFEKSDSFDKALKDMRDEELQPLRDDMVGNRRSVRMLSGISGLVIVIAGGVYSQWKPWGDDIAKAKAARDEQMAKWQYDVGQELRRDDNRLTVIEFRLNNVDNKSSK